MIPQYLIVDTEEDARRLACVADQLPLEDGEVFRTIMACLPHEHSAIYELEVMGLDVATDLIVGGFGQYAVATAAFMVQMGRRIFDQLRRYSAYHNGVLLYHFHEDARGALVLRSFESGDFDPIEFVRQPIAKGRYWGRRAPRSMFDERPHC